MNSLSAKIFLTIVEYQSISAAARALYISQPAVSAHLNRLEEEMGTQLVQRQKGAHSILLTPEGTAFIPVAREWLSAEKTLQAFKDSCSRKTLRIAAAPSVAPYLLIPIVEKLQQTLPDIDLQLCPLPAGTSIIMNTPQPYDIVFRSTTYSHPSSTAVYAQTSFCRSPTSILCPADTPLPDRVLTPEELDLTFELRPISIEEPVAEWYQEHFPDNVASYYPPVWNILKVADHFDDPRCWSLSHVGIAEFLKAQKPGKLTTRQVSPAPPGRLVSIMVSRSYTRRDVLDAFLGCCREYLEERPYLTPLLPDSL